MSLPQWMRQLAQQCLPGGKERRQEKSGRTRLRVLPHLEVLEDRLTPSGNVLAFTTATQNLNTGQFSQAITVQLQNGSGKAVTATSDVTINLSTTSHSGIFLDTSGTLLNTPSVVIPKGSSSASFEYQDDQGGIPTLDAKAPALNLEASQQEVIGVSVIFASPAQSLTPGQASGPITVELYDPFDGPIIPPSPVTIQLSSTSKTGQFLDTSSKALAHNSLTFPAGSSMTQFEYKDSQAGMPELSAALDGVSSQLQFNVGTTLVFTTAPQNIKAGQASGTITVQMQDGHGKAVSAPNTLELVLSSNSATGTFFDNKGNPISSSIEIPAGTSSISFKYQDSVGGTPSLTAEVSSSSGVGFSTNQQESVAGPYKVALGAPPSKIGQSQASGPITVELLDSTGNVATPKSAVTVQLSSSSKSGIFLDASGKPLNSGHLIIPAGSGTAQFEYKDSKAGFPTLTVSENGYSSNTQVNVGVSLVVTTPPQKLIAGKPSGNITIQLQDGNGKAFTTDSSLYFYLTSNSDTGQFLDSSGNPLMSPYVNIATGSNSVSFKFKDTIGGTPILEATLSFTRGIEISATQQETVAGPYRVILGTPPSFIDPGQPSQPFTVMLLDSTGNVVKAPSAQTIQLSSSSNTGQFLDASGKVLSNNRLIVPAGSGSAQFEYKDSRAGFPTITVSSNGFTEQTQVNVGVSLVFTTPAQKLTAGQKSQPITVQLQDNNGKAITAPGTMMLFLYSNSRTGTFYDSQGNPFPLGFSIPVGSSSISFVYKDSLGGKPTLFATVSSMMETSIAASQQESVTGPYSVTFANPPLATPIVPNQPSQPFTVELLDSTGNVVKTPGAVTVQLSSSSTTGQFLDTSGKVLANNRITIPAGASSIPFEYKDSQAGLPTLTISENGSTSQQQVNVGVSLVFTTPAQKFAAGQKSQPITVQLQDSHGKPVTLSSDATIYLSSSQNWTQFLDLHSIEIPDSITISAGSSSASFLFQSNWGGTPTLTASLPGLPLSATQQETVQGLSALVFTTSPQTFVAGQKSQRITVQLEDNNGKPAAAPGGGLTINLSQSAAPPSDGTTPQFFDTLGNPLPSSGITYFYGSTLIMPAGASTVSFEFETTQGGPISIYANVLNGFSAQQVETVQAGPAHSLVFETPALSTAAGAPTGSITVQLQDQYGNPVTAGSGGVTFTLHSSSTSGKFLSANGDALTGSTVTLLKGLSSATFEYEDSHAGTPTLTVSAGGFSATQTESITPISAEIHVTNTKDSGNGSLRAAIVQANGHPGSTIVFDSGVRGTIDLLSALPTLTASMNILGPGANLLTIERSASATSDFGIFFVGDTTTAAEPTVVLSGLTLANGTQAGIDNLGYLTLQHVVVQNNHAVAINGPTPNPFPFGSPGGIENIGNLTVLDSTIANNSTANTGAAAAIDSRFGPVLIINSTISGNQGLNNYKTGGIGIYGGTAVIENSTISGNTSSQQLNITNNVGGGIDATAPVVLYDTIVAGNTGLGNNAGDVSGPILSLGHNLIGKMNQSGSGFISSDLVGTLAKPIDPKLGALANNGGPTPTMALLAGSPALGVGSPVNAPSTDQRGDPRPQGVLDIGAVEESDVLT